MPLAGTKLYLGTTLLGGSAVDQNQSAVLATDVDTTTSTRLSAFTVTASATPHTAGAWVEIASSLPAAAAGVEIIVTAGTSVSAANSSTLLEIGTGASGSESLWATIGVGYLSPSSTSPAVFLVPGALASGTRVAVRTRSAVVSQSFTIRPQFTAAKTLALRSPVTYQADTSTSRGLTITAPGSLNTKGAWTELVTSTSARLSALLVCVQAAAGTNMASTGVLVDIGTGGAGSETVLLPNLFYAASSSEFYNSRNRLTYGVDIPPGTRIAARYARASTGNAVDIILVGA